MTQDPRPSPVNKDNWSDLRKQGFEHLTNIGASPMGDDPAWMDDAAYINELYERYGDNVKIGDALNPRTGLPDAEFGRLQGMCGVYAKRR